MAKLVVHHLENSRSHRVLWLLEELGVPYELVRYARNPVTMRAPPTLDRLHPLGKSPLVTVDDDLVLAESGAIIEYLVDTYGEGRLRPEPGTEAHQRYRFWLHYAEGSLMPPLLVRLVFDRVRKAPVPFFIKPITKGIVAKVESTFTGPEIAKHVAFIEGELAKREYLCGDELTAADVQMSFPLEALVLRQRSQERTPAIAAFLDRIHARPAYGKALERGGPYDLAMG